MHANDGQVTPETQAIDVFKTVSQAQADIASVRALLGICIDYYDDRPATEPLCGCIKLLRTLSPAKSAKVHELIIALVAWGISKARAKRMAQRNGGRA